MNLVISHNRYRSFGGEEAVIDIQRQLLEIHGHEVKLFFRSSSEIQKMRFGRARALVSCFYSLSSRRAIRHGICLNRPQLAHIHNLYPFVSPSVLPEMRRLGVPVVMTVHNYRLVCPSGLHMVHGQPCERCCGGHEYWCILKNCEGSFFKSTGYALRNWVARKARYYKNNVTLYMALTEFQRQRLIAEGYDAERIEVVPNSYNTDYSSLMAHHSSLITHGSSAGEYVGFVGRVSPEKGIATLVRAAAKTNDIPIRIVGSFDRMPDIQRTVPNNVFFLGVFSKERVREFYRSCRFIVLPSICFEGFPNILLEAAVHGKPVICSRIGGLPEIVDDGVTGLLVEPGNAEDLAEKVQYLWDRPDLCRELGQNAREKALREYSPEKHYERLMAVYKKAIALGPGGPSRGSENILPI